MFNVKKSDSDASENNKTRNTLTLSSFRNLSSRYEREKQEESGKE